jgi:beta-mannosidase
MRGFPLLRKAHCMFGWDWGPRLPDAGIWRDISLVGIETARIESVYVTQAHDNRRVTLQTATSVESISPNRDISVKVAAISPDGQVWFAEGTDCEILIEDPRLWWPNGLGGQPLYTVRAELMCGGRVIDRWERRIGLRTMTVSIKKDEWGESFSHCVNGVEFFAMGADYIPEDNILSRVNPERTRRLLEDAAEAHFNVIRVWGGGYYPGDFFYDICDELGLVVWQDFMFACAVYNLTDEFEQNICAEITDNVRRIRHHASLGLWCGNNEMEMFVAMGEWVSSDRQKADYIKMYEYIFPKILKAEDPQTFYWPASPSSGGSFDKPNDPHRGDVHYWEVWHGGLPFTDYRNHKFRYVSEFGFQSFPGLKTIEAFTEPADRNVFSYVMEKHQRNASANGKILQYLSQMYLYPKDLGTLVYASQLLQAQAMQYGVEHWRRNRGQCMGAVIWQLNDCWPVASWSSIDYFGRWKALHYYMKRFFAPVLISCHEEGVLSQNTNVNAEPFMLEKSTRLSVSNETSQEFTGVARWSLRRPDASVIKEGELNVSVPAYSSAWQPVQNFSEEDTYGCYYAYELESGGEIIGGGSVLFCPPKHFKFEAPKLSGRIEGDEIIVTASAYARSVEIICDDDTVLDDNYFDLSGGERRVRILRGAPKSVSVRSVFDIK